MAMRNSSSMGLMWRSNLSVCQVNGGMGRRALSMYSTGKNWCLKPVLTTSSATCSNRRIASFAPRIQTRFLAQFPGSAAAASDTFATSASPESLSLLEELGNPRLKKAITFQNRILALEGAIRMVFTSSGERYGWGKDSKDIGLLGLKGSDIPGYEDTGYFFDFPLVKMKNGRWIVDPPLGMKREFCSRRKFEKLGDVFDVKRRYEENEGKRYREYVEEVVGRLIGEGKKFGGVVLEPVVTGSGTMEFVDPLFQYALTETIRTNPQLFTSTPPPPPSDPETWTGLPIIFNETFTGSYNLGRLNSASFLPTHPDISIQAKTPAAEELTTLLSEGIFNTLPQNEKDTVVDANQLFPDPALKLLANGSEWQNAKGLWKHESHPENGEEIWSIWSNEFIRRISLSKDVESVMALGGILVVNLFAESTGSWSPKTADGLLKRVQLEDPKSHNIKSGVSGKKHFYIVGSLESTLKVVKDVEGTLENALLE